MAKVVLSKTRAHLVGDNAAVAAVADQIAALKQAIEDGGGEWNGGVEVALDDEPAPVVEAAAAAAPEDEPGQEPDADPVP